MPSLDSQFDSNNGPRRSAGGASGGGPRGPNGPENPLCEMSFGAEAELFRRDHVVDLGERAAEIAEAFEQETDLAKKQELISELAEINESLEALSI